MANQLPLKRRFTRQLGKLTATSLSADSHKVTSAAFPEASVTVLACRL